MRRDTTGYTVFGRILDRLCEEKRMSFRALAVASQLQPGYHTVIAKCCRGEVRPKRELIVAWAHILEATPGQRHDLLRAFQYADEDPGQGELEEARARIATLEQELEEARARNAELERR